MHNIAVAVEDEPSAELLDEMEIEPPDTLLGLYQGTPLTERGWDYGNRCPIGFTLSRAPHERAARGREDLVVAIGETLIHEIGHYFGLSEQQIGAIEDATTGAGQPASSDGDDGVALARKRFGQHFLEAAWADKVVAAIAPAPNETFLEIGPGRGALTRPLAARAKHVLAFEIDRDLVADLRAALPPNVRVEQGDFLDVRADQLRAGNWLPETGDPLRVAGNLPYNVASPILFKLVDLYAAGVPLSDATLMLQREVADRLARGARHARLRRPDHPHRAPRADVERLLALPPGAFRPPPKVRSALVRLRFHPPDPPARDESVFRAVVQSIFTRRRKTLANALLAFRGIGPGDSARPGAGADGNRRRAASGNADHRRARQARRRVCTFRFLR